jgi:SPP1 gp7 family putative phage head morphogenesis protein
VPKAALRDPRITREAATVNEAIVHRTLRHAHHLERLKTHEVSRIVDHMNKEVLPDVLNKLMAKLEKMKERGIELSPRSIERLRQALSEGFWVLKAGMSKTYKELQDALIEIGKAEAEWMTKVLNDQFVAVDIEATMPATELIKAAVTKRPFQGAVLRDWWKSVETAARRDIEKQIRIGLTEGEGTHQIRRRIDGHFFKKIRGKQRRVSLRGTAYAKARRNAEAVTRTAVNHVTTQAREDTFKANSHLVAKVKWVSTLDSRTTPICQSRDGRIYRLNEGPRPPAHYGCRSQITPVTKSWKELGLDLKDAPPSTRASMNGQVPATETYGTWLKKQPAAFQDDVLGPTRGRLLREGKVPVDRFVDDRGKRITLERLREIEGLSAKDVDVRRKNAS